MKKQSDYIPNDSDRNAIKKSAIVESLKNGVSLVSAIAAADAKHSTVYDWLDDDKEFCSAVHAAKNSRVNIVEDALYKKAIEGNVVAQIFYLCNRMPEKWKNVQKVYIADKSEEAAQAAAVREKVQGFLADIRGKRDVKSVVGAVASISNGSGGNGSSGD